MGTQERKARERKNRENLIIDAAEKVFFTKGFEQSSMDDIAREAELSKGSLYNYFKNKNELCIGIVSRSLNIIIHYINSEELEDSGLARVMNIAKAFMKFQQDNPKYYCALQSYRQHRCGCGQNSKFLNLTLEENQKIREIITFALKQGIKDKSIRAEIDAVKAANALWGEANGIFPALDLSCKDSNACEYAIELIINSLKT